MVRRKAQPVALQRVFIMDPAKPLRPIREVDTMIVVGPKMTWAEESHGRRHLMGTSAFMTLPSAERAKRGALVKIVQTPYLSRMAQTMDMYHNAERQLLLFEQNGTFVRPRRPN